MIPSTYCTRKHDWSGVRSCVSDRKAISSYRASFSLDAEDLNDLFIYYYGIEPNKTFRRISLSRSQFLFLVLCAKCILSESNVGFGDSCLHYFTSNSIEDLVFRTAAIGIGSIPVTVNWDNDTIERICFKRHVSNAKLILYDDSTNFESIRSNLLVTGVLALNPREALSVAAVDLCRSNNLALDHDSLPFLPSATSCTDFFFRLASQAHEPQSAIDVVFPDAVPLMTDPKIIIFTSGTTNNPKGVRLSYLNYEFNRAEFDNLMGFSTVSTSDLLIRDGNDNSDLSRIWMAIVNPLHHTNSSAMTDWACRRPRSRIYLFQRYSTLYWSALKEIVCNHDINLMASDGWSDMAGRYLDDHRIKIVTPLVSRHIDFLSDLYLGSAIKSVPLPPSDLISSYRHIVPLLGSAPVGPKTISSLQSIIGKAPMIRFGSTETCLQVLGTRDVSDMTIKIEYGSSRCDGKSIGYFVGQDHYPFNEVRIVKSINPDDDVYLVDCDADEDGLIITAGGNIMKGYIVEADTANVITESGWFLGLGDIGFWMPSSSSNEKDFFWVGRTSNMLIKGGSNYSYDQITGDVSDMIHRLFGLTCAAETGDYDMAVIGIRMESEHEDDCCLLVNLVSDGAVQLRERVEEAIMREVDGKRLLNKGSRPDRLMFGKIPRNFKGLVELKRLRDIWLNNKPCK